MTTKLSISKYPDGRYCLDLMDADERTRALFESRKFQGGGYTWEGIVRSLIEMRMPEALPQLSLGAEADNMYVYCSSRELLEDLAALIRAAIEDQQILISAIEHGGEEIE
jgi:hypothetical protein